MENCIWSAVSRAWRAAILVARTLGVSEVAVEPADSEPLLDEGHWGYAFYSWLDRFGLMEGNPEQLLTKEEGKAFLDSIFPVILRHSPKWRSQRQTLKLLTPCAPLSAAT